MDVNSLWGNDTHTNEEKWVTYPGDGLAHVIHVVPIPELMYLYNDLQEGHIRIDRHAKRKILHELNTNADISMDCLVNKPVLEAIPIIKFLQSVDSLPDQTSRVFATTATANSGNNSAPIDALRIMGVDIDMEKVNVIGTVTNNGRTGVSKVQPKNASVSYDENAQWKDWHFVTQKLYEQFKKSSEFKTYSHMFHWGCISQNWILGLHNTQVSSWALHEPWSLNMTIAMMRHAVEFLADDGVLCLKIRTFKKAETLGLTSLLSLAFKKTELISNHRQQCTFVTFIGIGFRGVVHPVVQRITSILATSLTYAPSHIFCHELVTMPEYRDFLQKCEMISKQMLTVKSKRTTVWLAILRLLANSVKRRQRIPFSDEVSNIICKIVPHDSPLHKSCLQLYYKIHETLVRDEDKRFLFMSVMEDSWVRESC